MLDEKDKGLECSSTDLYVEKELDLLACKEEARKLDFDFVRHSNLTIDVTNGTEMMTETNSTTETNNITETNMTEYSITDLCQIYKSCDEIISSTDGNTYQYSGKSYLYINIDSPVILTEIHRNKKCSLKSLQVMDIAWYRVTSYGCAMLSLSLIHI